VGVHSKTCNAELFKEIEDVAVVFDNNVIQHMKACKNEVE
jgi:hypothetical protein